MKRFRFIGVRFVAIRVIAVTVLSFAVMGLWNWLAPAVFGGHTITFWQALGLLALTRILFGGFRGRHGHWRHRMHQRWTDQMTPEEREKFRDRLRRRCGQSAAGPSEPVTSI